MPVSKNKRKNRKQRLRQARQMRLPKPSVLPGQTQEENTVLGQSAKIAKVEVKDKTNGCRVMSQGKAKKGIREMLLANNGDGLMQLVIFSPFFTGAWLAGGLVLDDVLAFAVLSCLLIVAHYTAPLTKRDDVIFVKDFKMILYLAQAGLVYLFYYFTGQNLEVILAAGAALLVTAAGFIPLDSVRRLLTFIVVLIIEMGVFALLGINSQVHHLKYGIAVEHAVLGVTPAFLLAAAFIARYSEIFVRAGWQRKRTKTAKDGALRVLPGPLSIIYSLLLLLGPAIPVAFAPLGIFPSSFMLCALTYLFVPKYAELFLEEKESDLSLALKAIKLAGFSSILVFLAAFLADYF